MNAAVMPARSPVLDRIRTDLKQARRRLAIARIDGDPDMTGAIEIQIGELEQAETRAEALLRHRHDDYRKRRRNPARARA